METSRNRRRLAGIAFALLAAVAAVGPVSANSGVSATVQSQASRATAVVSFRIVVPEVVAFNAGVQRQPANAPTLTRTEAVESGIRIVTIARP